MNSFLALGWYLAGFATPFAVIAYLASQDRIKVKLLEFNNEEEAENDQR